MNMDYQNMSTAKYIWIIHQLNHIWMNAHGISSFGVEFSSKKKPVEEL